MAALRKRLEGLMRREEVKPEKQEVHLKPMPCLKAEGLDRKMYWCCIGEEGKTLDEEMKGMYQILKALREIVKYGRDEYWPWFRETMLWES
ncbi:hypothetical protein V2W45_1339480 [Cenococcum geophilum]